MIISVPVSIGEMLDKITILEIKLRRISDPEKRKNIQREYTELDKVRRDHRLFSTQLDKLVAELEKINEQLWDIEDSIRELERLGEFNQEFIALARAVYKTNDRRAALKKSINLLTGSVLAEEKSYSDY